MPALESVPTVPDPAELTPAEVGALEQADRLDSGALAESLAAASHAVAFDSAVGPEELRRLAARALVLARRTDGTLAHPDD